MTFFAAIIMILHTSTAAVAAGVRANREELPNWAVKQLTQMGLLDVMIGDQNGNINPKKPSWFLCFRMRSTEMDTLKKERE